MNKCTSFKWYFQNNNKKGLKQGYGGKRIIC